MTAAYVAAAIPEPFQILGLRLKPLCLGHYFLLERFENAFVSNKDAVATFDDLIMGVLICSMTYEEFMEFLFQSDFEEQVFQWGKKCGVFDLAEKCRLFHEYITKGSEQPIVFYEQEQGAPTGAHWGELLKLVLTGELGYTSSEALNLPLTQALHEFYKNAENKGIVTIAREDEVEAVKSAQAREAANA